MYRLKIATVFGLALLFGVLGNAGTSEAILISGTCDGLSASADFTVSGNTLTVVLTNTSANDVLIPSEVLTAVFFDIAGFSGTLTPVSALLSGGSTVFFGSDGGGNVGGEFAYANNLSGAPNSADMGISSAGFGLFGENNFNGPNLGGPTAVDGLQYGITSAGDNPATGNAAVTGGNELIKNQVTFTLTSDTAFLESAITNVSFQYGTSLSETNCTPGDHPTVPEPSTMLLLGLALSGSGGIGFLRRRRKGTHSTR